MQQKTTVKNLLDRPMSRQEFLKVAGVGALSVFGAGNAIAMLMSSRQPNQRTVVVRKTVESSSGFGSRKFGV